MFVPAAVRRASTSMNKFRRISLRREMYVYIICTDDEVRSFLNSTRGARYPVATWTMDVCVRGAFEKLMAWRNNNRLQLSLTFLRYLPGTGCIYPSDVPTSLYHLCKPIRRGRRNKRTRPSHLMENFCFAEHLLEFRSRAG